MKTQKYKKEHLEFWECPDCNKFFKDISLKTLIVTEYYKIGKELAINIKKYYICPNCNKQIPNSYREKDYKTKTKHQLY